MTSPHRSAALLLAGLVLSTLPASGQGAAFEEAVVDVGNVGLTVTNAGFIGRAGVRNNPTGTPSFEYPLDSGVEHLFEAGLWVGAVRSDGTVTVRTGAVTTSGGYSPGGSGFELAPLAPFRERSSLLDADAFSRSAVSHQDFLTAYADTFAFLPGTSIPMPDPQGRLGLVAEQSSYAWNFPFTESFVLLNLDIVNTSSAAWDSVEVGLWYDLVVRNVNTTTEGGGDFFNKGGYGILDSLQTIYGFNAGGSEETINTYGAIAFLGAEWPDPQTGQRRFFHPEVAERYAAAGLPVPAFNTRWWRFSGGTAELSRPDDDAARYRRMQTPQPDPATFGTEAAYQEALDDFREQLRTRGAQADGNWIGLLSIGTFPSVAPGDTLQATFAFVAALKPETFQGQEGKAVDTPESRRLLVNSIEWARRTYSGEDNDYDGELDAGEDVNGNGRLDRYLIPEPPRSPRLRVEFEEDGGVLVYWDRSAETSVDPVSGERDFEGYRIYRTDPGDDRADVALLDQAGLVAQFDQAGNQTGFNNGFEAIRLSEPITFPGDTTRYAYCFDAGDLLSGWQYLFSVTAFDEGDTDAGLPSFESGRTANAVRVFPGTPPAEAGAGRAVGVYPNPYRAGAAWDGTSSRTRKLNFYNLPPRATVRIYTLAGEVVDQFSHDADSYQGDTGWYDTFGGNAEARRQPGGEHAWDLLSEGSLDIAGGLYLFTVEDLDTGDVQRGKFVIIK